MTIPTIANSKVAIFSDLHLGVRQNSIEWHRISLEWCDWFVNLLEKEQITDVLFLGDLFHYRDEIAVNTLYVGYQLLKKLEKYNKIMIPGNHDSFYRHHSDVNSIKVFDGWSNLYICDEITSVIIGGKQCLFVPWGKDFTQSPRHDYLFGHLEIKTFRMNNSKTCDHGLEVDACLRVAPRVFSGHFHLREARTFPTGTVVYVGNPFEMDFGDAGSTKGVFILDTVQETVRFVENTISPRHIRVPISDIQNHTSAQLAGNIVKVVVDKKLPAVDVERILNECKQHSPLAVLSEYALPGIKLASDAPAESLNGVSFSQAIHEFVHQLNPPNLADVLAVCEDIYNSQQ